MIIVALILLCPLPWLAPLSVPVSRRQEGSCVLERETASSLKAGFPADGSSSDSLSLSVSPRAFLARRLSFGSPCTSRPGGGPLPALL